MTFRASPCASLGECTTPKLCFSVGTCKGIRVMPAAVRAQAEATRRLCGYCHTWRSAPCGEGCCWQHNDPTLDELRQEPVVCSHRRLTDAELDAIFESFERASLAVEHEPDAKALMRAICRAAIAKVGA